MKTKRSSKLLASLPLLASTLVASGCATFGLVYEDVGHPPMEVVGDTRSPGLAWDPNLNASMEGRELTKRGVACSQDILKLVAWGDGTQAAAAKQGGITEVVGVDFENTAILAFIYTRNCTVVYGNDAAGTPVPPANATMEPAPTAEPVAPAPVAPEATAPAPTDVATPVPTTAPTAPAP